jgi:hypothetical protein
MILETELDLLYQVLIKKSIDATIFMAEEADKVLIGMCRIFNEGKILPLFLQMSTNKSSLVRA